ncbi:hypothetical protein EG327_004336 [Venturia inaequalis]|uniref:Uncharacterized protein n=1 Tax=Venturia inaequalis TaxID=5025 RepID=A0A8H3VU23_VENIN|nr:hypothetical protein EG327_004336 [Venturia inaequalis]
MRIPIILLTLPILTLATPNLEKRQTTDSKPSLLSSAVSQLISLYIPTSVYPALSSAAAAHTLTGDVASLLASALTATAIPAWISAVPTQYSANIASLESRVSELRGAVSVGSIEGAPRVVTTTGDGGVVAVTTVPGASASGTGTAGGASMTMLTGTNTRSAMATGTGGSGSGSTQAAASTSRSSSGFAMATEVPAAIMGVAGLLGLVVAL